MPSPTEGVQFGAMMQTKGLMVMVVTMLHGAGLIGVPVFSGMAAMAVVCTVLTAPAVRLCAAERRGGWRLPSFPGGKP